MYFQPFWGAPSISNVTGDKTYTAQFSTSSVKTYKVTWKNWDGTVLETDTNVAYGTTPTFDGSQPSKFSDDSYVYYQFVGWSPEVKSVSGDATYTAQFETKDFEGTTGLSFTYNENYQGYFVSGYRGSDETVVVPRKYNGLPVVVVGTSEYENYKYYIAGFAFNTRIKKVILPDTVWGLNLGAFYNCSSLEEVVMPNVTHIFDEAFFGCSGLTSITIPEGVTSIGQNTFSGCISLTSITIPNSVTSIGDGAFSSNQALKNIIISETVTSIGSYIFENCYNLEEVIINGTISTGSRFLFQNCVKLKKLTINKGIIPSSLIGANYDGSNNPPLEEIYIGEVVSLGNDIFKYCGTFIKKITILSGYITEDTLSGCTNLEELYFSENCTLNSQALKYCTSLSNLTIPTLNDHLGTLFDKTTSISITYSIWPGWYLNSLPNFTYTQYKTINFGRTEMYAQHQLPLAWKVSNFWFINSNNKDVLLVGPYTINYNTESFTYEWNYFIYNTTYKLPGSVSGTFYHIPKNLNLRILDDSISSDSVYLENCDFSITIG